MVASDTVVGAVGAVVLVVALVGVFVLESEPAFSRKDLAATRPKATVEGNVAVTEAVGPAPGTPCLPNSPPPVCTPASTSISLTLKDLPAIAAPAALQVWVSNASFADPVKVGGAMAYSNGQYSISNAEVDADGTRSLVFVTYERTTGATAPNTELVVYQHTYNGADATLTGSPEVAFATGTATTVLAEEGGAVDATVHVFDATNRTGFVYTAWLIHNDGSAKFIEKCEPVGQGVTCEAHGKVDGALNTFQSVVVTLEPSGGQGGTMEGWPVFSTSLRSPIDPAPK